jgi:hypothetical protein
MTTRPATRRRRRRILALASIPLGLMASGLFVWQASQAAFTATTVNPANSWTAGTVTLTDDDTGTAMFAATGLTPGSTGTKCIEVTYNGTIAASGVRLYGGSTPGTPDLSPYLDLTIDEGSGATFAAGCGSFVLGSNLYTGTLGTFASTRTNYASGVSAWAPAAAGAKKVYRFTYTLDAATPDSAQGGTATATFNWEARS